MTKHHLSQLFAAAVAAISICMPAHAQNAGSVTNHAFAIGKGAGVAGYTSLLCGAGQIALGQSSADPICRTMSGDATIDAAGALAIGANKVTNSMLRQSGALAVIGRSANSTGNVADIQATAASDGVLRENGSSIGFGTIATGGIANNAVTDAKLRQGGALSLIGRSANSTGNVADIQATAASDGVLRENGSTIGFGTIATGGIANNAVTDAKLRQGGALSFIGRSANSTGNVADISASAGSSCAFRESSNTIGCGTLATAAYAANSVTNAKLAQMANATFKCRTTAGTGDPEDCTATQSTALLNAMVGDSGSGGTKGLVPAAGAGDAAAGKYLKADGTFAVPPGTGGGGSLADSDRQNILLVQIYQSKSFGDIRRLINQFSTGLKASTSVLRGLATETNADVSNASASGYVLPSITAGTNQIPLMTSNSAPSGTAAASSENGASTAAWKAMDRSTSTSWLTLSGATGTLSYTFSGAKTIASYTVEGWASSASASTANRSPSAWTFQYDAGGGTWTTLDTQSGLSWSDGQIRSFNVASPVSATSYRLNITANNGDALVGLVEWTMLDANVTNNMTLVTTSQTADASVSNGRVLLEYDNTGSPALNTDLTAEVTCNNGTNWASASLSSVSTNGQGGRKIVESVDQACTSGTSFAARIKTLNNKNVPIYGISLTVH